MGTNNTLRKLNLLYLLRFIFTFNFYLIIIIIIIRVFCPRASPSLQAWEPRLQFCRRQIFHRKLRNQGCSFTRDWINAVATRCFLHPTLSLASEQTLKDLERSQGHQCEGEESGCTYWAIRTSPNSFPYILRKKSEYVLPLNVFYTA